jgi:hypothetical protein
MAVFNETDFSAGVLGAQVLGRVTTFVWAFILVTIFTRVTVCPQVSEEESKEE